MQSIEVKIQCAEVSCRKSFPLLMILTKLTRLFLTVEIVGFTIRFLSFLGSFLGWTRLWYLILRQKNPQYTLLKYNQALGVYLGEWPLFHITP